MTITRPRQVGIYVYPEAEVLDFAAPYEGFSTASRVAGRRWPGTPRPFDVVLIARSSELVRARHGFETRATHSISAHLQLDVLVVAGGVPTGELDEPQVIEWVGRCGGLCELVASVCTGAFLLGKAGLLDGKPATTHWEDLDELAAMLPGTSVQREVHWVEAGTVVTAAGISAGIDMCLYLVERLVGHELAAATARRMQYDWRR
jgi:transcriptional regulator GlxA family with amidase domain